MNKTIKDKLIRIYKENKVSPLDKQTVSIIALQLKMYDVVVYICNNSTEYHSFAKTYLSTVKDK